MTITEKKSKRTATFKWSEFSLPDVREKMGLGSHEVLVGRFENAEKEEWFERIQEHVTKRPEYFTTKFFLMSEEELKGKQKKEESRVTIHYQSSIEGEYKKSYDRKHVLEEVERCLEEEGSTVYYKVSEGEGVNKKNRPTLLSAEEAKMVIQRGVEAIYVFKKQVQSSLCSIKAVA